MKIVSVSSLDKQATITLSDDELIKICNAVYYYYENTNSPCITHCSQLLSELNIARDICQYGHLDDFLVETVAKLRGLPHEKS